MNPERHPLDQLLDLLDDRLSADARREVDAHVRDCSVCQRELAALTAARAALRTLTPPPLPDGLEARILASLDAADRGARATSVADAPARTAGDTSARVGGERPSGSTSDFPPRTTSGVAAPAASRRPWMALAALAAGVLLAAVLWWRPSSDLPDAAANHVRAYRARQLALASDVTAADAAQTYLAARVTFPVRVFDLGMMGYSIAGASVLDLNGRTAAAWVYRSDAGWLLCEMFLATLDDLPAADETRSANGIDFRIYHRDGGTQVFWAEGDVLCVLASTLPADDVVQLAMAKAMKP